MSTEAQARKLAELQGRLTIHRQRRELQYQILDMMIGMEGAEWSRREVEAVVADAFSEYQNLWDQAMRMRAS